MKKRIRALLLLFGFVVLLLAWVAGSRSSAWRRDYAQAESLVEIIWPMAFEMKRFSDERGRPPNSLDELAAFSPDHNFSSLRHYPHDFHTIGQRLFFLRVNRRFAFVVDEQFKPGWHQPTGVLQAATNPQ